MCLMGRQTLLYLSIMYVITLFQCPSGQAYRCATASVNKCSFTDAEVE